MKRYSFRWRFVMALGVWTIGLFILAHGLSAPLFEYFPILSTISRGVGLFIFAAGFLVAGLGLGFGKSGMARFNELRRSLSAVRDGNATRVLGDYPSEIQPLVDDLNTLLEHREHVVRRAQAEAADLAHGLKTPLALLEREADEARRHGDCETARGISEQVERMRRQLEYHLAHARATGSGPVPGVRTVVGEAADGVVRALRRLYADRSLVIEVDVDPAHAVRCQRVDLDEMLGNLLDNACKWARSRIELRSSLESGGVTVTVDDDGPGIEASQRAGALKRGVRIDETTSGTGLGLAIVRDLAELYEGSIELGEARIGGLRATLTLPGR